MRKTPKNIGMANSATITRANLPYSKVVSVSGRMTPYTDRYRQWVFKRGNVKLDFVFN